MGLKPGYLVSKHVQLVRELKRGGMGSVWIADHLALNTQVAVKFMAASIVDDAAAVARFAREATSAAQIKSPHVVQIHDHGVTPEGVPYMVMELLHGEDLSTRIKRVGQMPLEEAAQIVVQVCRVLSRAHRAGIVHRDIKPSNIFLIDTDGETFVKVLDFGVAKLGDDGGHELTTTGAMVGTLVYMSPEQLLSARSVDHRADLWSLGVVVYRAITGELPFKNDDGLGALCRAVEKGSFAAPSTLVPGIGPEVDAWFERAFAARLEDRFRSAKTHVRRAPAGDGPHLGASPVAAELAAIRRSGGSWARRVDAFRAGPGHGDPPHLPAPPGRPGGGPPRRRAERRQDRRHRADRGRAGADAGRDGVDTASHRGAAGDLGPRRRRRWRSC